MFVILLTFTLCFFPLPSHIHFRSSDNDKIQGVTRPCSNVASMLSPVCCGNEDGGRRVGEEEAPQTPAVETFKRSLFNAYHSFEISTQV